ncbi:hypothetical protein [Saccharicrinis sp. GN24d3]|uniref:hypothetical protein n=1 Tax=Saccharicrinis sp. GN24d3 TaxID=3458416 RepID=UPI004036FCEE
MCNRFSNAYCGFKYEGKSQVVHIANGLYMCRVDSYEKQIENTIGKPYEGKLHSLSRTSGYGLMQGALIVYI